MDDKIKPVAAISGCSEETYKQKWEEHYEQKRKEYFKQAKAKMEPHKSLSGFESAFEESIEATDPQQ